MKKVLMAGIAAATMIFAAAPAAAQVVVDPISGPNLELFGTEAFGTTRGPLETPGAFSDLYGFLTTTTWDANSQVSSIIISGLDIDFSSIFLDTYAFTQTGFDPGAEVWELPLSYLAPAGAHSVTVNGTMLTAGGSYVGTINVAAPVPEPAAWAMMLLGFGAIGYAMRGRRKPLLQLA